jgi:hypothetical protein
MVLAAVVAISLTTFRGVTQTRGLYEDSAAVVHTHDVREKLRDFLLDTTTAETSIRGFLLSGDPDLLAAYGEVRPKIEPELQHLVRLTADNTAEQNRLTALGTYVRTKLDALDHVVRVNRDEGLEAARALVSRAPGSGRWSMSEIRRIAAEMDADEEGLLDARVVQTSTHYRRVVNNLLLDGVACGCLLLAIGFIVNVHLGDRARTAETLRASESRYRIAASAAERANVIKDEFLAILSHELRTPLNAVLGWTQMLRSGSVQGATVHRAVSAIERNARAQQRLVEDLLDVSRIVTGKFELDRQPTQLAQIVSSAVEAQRPSAAERGLDLVVRIEGAPIVNADALRAQQAIGNLLSNAIKFTPSGGRVSVELETRTRSATLVVRDTGIGIGEELLPFIFDRFRQGDSSMTRAHSGLGLGLAIVRHVVEAHGGSIQAESAGAGQGATFTVTWPTIDVSAAAPRPAPPAERVRSAESLSGVSVLLVDDDADSREVMAFALRQHGARVRTAESAATALADIALQRPDIVVTDLQMPDRSGLDLLREIQLRTEPGGRAVPVIAVTAHAMPDDGAMALASGFSAYLTKPVDVSKMVDVLGAAAAQGTS